MVPLPSGEPLTEPTVSQRPQRAFDHARLRPWSPYTRRERAQWRDWVDKLSGTPWATWTVVALLGWFYLVQLVLGWPLAAALPDGSDLGAALGMDYVGEQMGVLKPQAVLAGEGWRLITATLLHASLLHIAGNCLVLVMLGRIVENAYGRSMWLVTYIGAGLSGTMLAAFVAGHESLGASGAVLGMLGAICSFGVRNWKHIPRPLRDFFGIDLWVFVALVAVTSLLPFVDWAGHLGGFLWGAVVGWFWPAAMMGQRLGDAGRRRANVLLGLMLGASLYALTVVGFRIAHSNSAEGLREWDLILRSLRAEDYDGLLVGLDRLGERLPERWDLEQQRILVLMTAERFAEAAQVARKLERAHPEVRRDRAWDNTVAWALLRGHPDDPARVAEGLTRAKRALARNPGDDAVENTYALGLLLSGQAEAAEGKLRELVEAKERFSVGRLLLTGSNDDPTVASDAFMHVMALVGLGRDDEAKRRWVRYSEEFAEGEMRAECAALLRERGLLAGPEPPAP